MNVPHLLESMSGLFRQSLGEMIGLTVESTPDSWRCMADPAELETVLLNLAVNSRDAMPNGGMLTIKFENVEFEQERENHAFQPGQYVMLSVRDTGSGMTPETLDRVFEPFFTTKAVEKGCGLSLSMVHGFVHQSSGQVTIDTELGAGTTVRLYLPRATAEVSTPEVSDQQSLTIPSGSAKILVVEDNDLLRLHVTSQLESLGYAVVAVPDGRAALEALERDGDFDFDLLFTDVVMPGGMSGFDLAQAIHLSRPRLPMLFTSGYTEAGSPWGERRKPQGTLLQKPYRRHQLAERVRAAIEWRSEPPSPPQSA